MTPLPEQMPALPRASARERIYETLKTWIVEGVLDPEEQLRDVDLAERFGTSRTPVREALRQLEDERLVETARNRWTRVAPLDLDEPVRIVPILAVLEGLALRLAWPVDEEAVKQMERTNAELGRAVERRRAKDALGADRRFHGVIDAASANPDLVALLARHRDRMRRIDLVYWARPALARDSVAEHAAILESVRERELEEAQRRLDQHWHNERVFRIREPGEGG